MLKKLNIIKLEHKNLVKQLRENYHLTQDEFAKKIFVSRQLVSSWENNNIIPSSDIIKLIHKEFNVSYFELFFKYGYGNLFFIKIIFSIIFIIIFFYILFTNIANNYVANVYVGKFENPQITMTNSFFIETKKRKSLYLGSVVNSSYEFDKIEVYYRTSDKSIYIYKGKYENDLVLDESANYHEYFASDFNLNELYIDLISEKSDLILTCKFSYEKIDYYYKNYSGNNISLDYDADENDILNITIAKLKEKGYVQDNEDLEIFTNGNYSYNTIDNTLTYHDDKIYIQLDTTFEVIELRKLSNSHTSYNGIEYYTIKNNEIICEKSSCEEDKRELNIILDEYDRLQEKNG